MVIGREVHRLGVAEDGGPHLDRNAKSLEKEIRRMPQVIEARVGSPKTFGERLKCSLAPIVVADEAAVRIGKSRSSSFNP